MFKRVKLLKSVLIILGILLTTLFFQNCGPQFKTATGDNSSLNQAAVPEPSPAPAPAPVPTPVQTAPKIQIGISTASEFSCRLSEQGLVSCAGDSGSGNFGVALANMYNPSLVRVPNVTNVKSLSSGVIPACALSTAGKVTCWGPGVGISPVEVVGLTGAKAVANTGLHKCVITANDTVACWGNNNTSGQLGYTGAASASPVEVANVSGVKELSVRSGSTCVIAAPDRVLCWGANRVGDLGVANVMMTSSAPVEVTGLTGVGAKSLSMGNNSSCIVTAQKTVKCWGRNLYGLLGNGAMSNNINDVFGVVDVVGVNNATAVAVGNFTACALTELGTVKCWGNGSYSTLGQNSRLSSTAVDIAGLPADIRAISMGFETICATTGANTTYC